MSLKYDKDKRRAWYRRYSRQRKGVLNATDELRIGKCALCPREGPLNLDHDHATGRIRGWICWQCNMYLGVYEKIKAKRLRLKMEVYLHV
jgi:Recombination endonuclease VII